MKLSSLALWLIFAMVLPGSAQTSAPSNGGADLDGDGISDSLEQSLLERFLPQFRISSGECDFAPAQFRPGRDLIVEQRDGTIYGQAFPHASASKDNGRFVELHFYHLWQTDCGQSSHPLDVEHVSVLIRSESAHPSLGDWKALYWFASAHQGTLCEKSHAASASKVNAVDVGPVVTISAGKHASYLDTALCTQGCGADRCNDASPLSVARVINLGEPGRPLNGLEWTSSPAWSLRQKMTTEFPDNVVAALQSPSNAEVMMTRSLPRGTQRTIKTAGSTASALTTANSNTGDALDTASQNTAKALDNSTRAVGNALHKAASNTGKFLGAARLGN